MEQLEKYFDTAFGATEGILKLRALVLNLAMRGLLVKTQDKSIGSKSDLNGLNLSKSETLNEVPFEIPRQWKWVNLGDICEINGGFAFKSSNYVNKGVRVVRISDFDERGFKNDKVVRYTFSSTLSAFELSINSILMAMTGGTVGKSLLVKDLPERMVVNQRVATIKPNKNILPSFLHFAIQSEFIQQRIHTLKNSTNDNISMSDIKGFPIPLPSVQTQTLIVSKINELMSRCDELEKLRAERDQKRLAVHTAAIRKMLDAQDQGTFDDAWQFITHHFGDLYTVRENVAELRKAILQLAVMGKLVPQDPKEGTAKELMEEIEREKRKMVKEGKIKESNPMINIKENEISYKLPKGWEWVRLGSLIELVSGQHLSPHEYNEKAEGFSYYTGPADFQELNPSPSRWTKIDRAIALNGDILITVKGAGVGKTNLLNEDKAAISRQLMAIRVICINRDYAHIFLKSIFYEFQSMAIGIAIPGIGREDVLHKQFPLPPLSEQNRIVQTTSNLMTNCDILENKIVALKNKKGEVLVALMKNMVN